MPNSDTPPEIIPTSRRKPKAEITTLGGRELKPATLMMGHGYDPALSEGSLKPPIFLTSTFAFESAAAGKRHFEGITGVREGGAEGLVYSRFNGPNQEILEDRLGIWDRAEDALVFSSGMSAIATLLLAYCGQGDVVVHSGPLYAATEGFIARQMSRYGVTYVDFPAGASREEIDRAIARGREQAAKQGGRLALIFLESPANPTNALVDIEAVSAARDAAFGDDGPPVAIDNTFLGPLWQRPLEHGADIVVYSLTKYAGGHSDLVAGGISGAKAMMDPVRSLRNTMGTICDPNTAWMLLRSLETARQVSTLADSLGLHNQVLAFNRSDKESIGSLPSEIREKLPKEHVIVPVLPGLSDRMLSTAVSVVSGVAIVAPAAASARSTERASRL